MIQVKAGLTRSHFSRKQPQMNREPVKLVTTGSKDFPFNASHSERAKKKASFVAALFSIPLHVMVVLQSLSSLKILWLFEAVDTRNCK